MIQYFDSELEEVWKNGYCLIHKGERCKCLTKWRQKNPIGKGIKFSGGIMRRKQPLKFPKGHKPKPKPQEDIDRENSKVGYGVQILSGFVGSKRKW